jgi:hypothetical protein
MSSRTLLGAVAVYMLFLYFRDLTNPAPDAKSVKPEAAPVMSARTPPPNDGSFDDFSKPDEISSDGFDDEFDDEFNEFDNAPVQRQSKVSETPEMQPMKVSSGQHDILVRFCTS